MPTLSFNGLLIVAIVAVAVPLLLELLPAARVPPVVLEIIGGALVGPFGLGFAHVDIPIQVLSDLGLGFLLFLAGYEIDPRHFRGQALRLALVGFGGSVVLAIGVSYLAHVGGAVKTPLLIAIPLMSTSLGVLLPVLRDAGEVHSALGQLVITASSIAEFVPIVLLSLFFSATSTSPIAQTALLGGFAVAVVVAGYVLLRVGHLPWLTRVLHRLEHTSSQLRVRIAITIALAFGVAALQFGLATILGAFLAGVIVRLLGQYEPEEQQLQFGYKLDALGFGFLIPIFFVTTGLGIDVRTLFESPIALIKVPMFLVAFLTVRAIPALAYRRVLGKPLLAASGLLQATTLTILIVAVDLGFSLHKMLPSTGVALLTAGLLSVLIFPPVALSLLRRDKVASADGGRYRAAALGTGHDWRISRRADTGCLGRQGALTNEPGNREEPESAPSRKAAHPDHREE